MALVPQQGVSGPAESGAAFTGQGGPGPAQVTAGPAVKDYPFSSAVFQNFTAQQYATAGTAGAAQTYTEVAPEEPADEPAPKTKAKARKAK